MNGQAALRILKREGLVTPVQIAEVHETMGRGDHVLSKLADAGVDPRAMAECLSRSLGVMLVELVTPSKRDIDRVSNHFGDSEVLWAKRALPLASNGESIVLGMADPSDVEFLQDLRFALGTNIEPRTISVRDVEAHLKPSSEASQFLNMFDPKTATLIQMVNFLLVHVVKTGEPASIVAGVKHPEDHPAPFDTSKLQIQTIKGMIRRLRFMTETTDEPNGSIQLIMGENEKALVYVEFSRFDQCATVYLQS